MKREIKFRGKSKTDGEWFYGNLFDKDTSGRTHIGTTKKGCLNIDPDTIGQFTGLKDKNGKEIYEHDLIEVRGIISEVVYNDKLGAYTLFELKTHNLGRRALGVMMTYFPDMIVIGNIHEDKHLLK